MTEACCSLWSPDRSMSMTKSTWLEAIRTPRTRFGKISSRASRFPASAARLRKTQIQRGYYEQIQQGGGDQAAQNHKGHRVFDLLAGDIAGNGQRDKGEARCQRGHQDRGKPFP